MRVGRRAAPLRARRRGAGRRRPPRRRGRARRCRRRSPRRARPTRPRAARGAFRAAVERRPGARRADLGPGAAAAGVGQRRAARDRGRARAGRAAAAPSRGTAPARCCASTSRATLPRAEVEHPPWGGSVAGRAARRSRHARSSTACRPTPGEPPLVASSGVETRGEHEARAALADRRGRARRVCAGAPSATTAGSTRSARWPPSSSTSPDPTSIGLGARHR